MKRFILHLFLVVSCGFMTGCASIISGPQQTIHVDSNPSGSKFTVYDAKGEVVESGITPATLELNRARGFFVAAKYRLAFNATGYYPGETAIGANVNGWYFGNIFFGGLVGFVIIDPFIGGMWNLNPDRITYTLVSSATPLSPEELKIAQAKANLPPPKTSTNAPPPRAGRR